MPYQIFPELLRILLVGFAAYAWLEWLFVGSVRQWVAALLFPNAWLGDKTRSEISDLSSVSFDAWLSLGSECWVKIRKLMFCRACLSLHVNLWLWVMLVLCTGCHLYPLLLLNLFASSGLSLYLSKK